MYTILDKLILFLCGITLYLFHSYTVFAIIPIILSILLSCLMFYFDNPKVSLATNLLFFLICIVCPFYIVFMPSLLYDIIHTKYQYAVIALPFLLIINHNHYNMIIVSFSILLMITTILLKYKTEKFYLLRLEYNELRDSSAEMSRLLKKKNQDLLKNQDDEIHLATLNERNRISIEIHDNIGHLLSRSLIQIGALLTIAKDETIIEGLTSLKTSLSEGMDSIRDSIHHMYDESIDLYSQINELVKGFTFCAIHFDYDILDSPPLVLKYSMIAIVKEALANIIKHSNATRVSITIREHPAMYQLIIFDNGTLEKQKKRKLAQMMDKANYEEGMGLRNITDRVESFAGNLNLILDNGFTLFITIPKKNSDD